MSVSQELSRLIGDLSREGIRFLSQSETRWASCSQAIREGKRSEKLVADLYQAADGNPLFVDGVGRLLVAEGRIDRQ